MESASHAHSAMEWVNQNSKYKRSSGTQSVLRTIAATYGSGGSCLSMADIVKRSSVSESTAHRAIRRLTCDGIIRVSLNGGDAKATGYTNRYQIFGFDLPVENGRGVTSNMTPRRAEHDTSQEGVSQKHDTPHTPKTTPVTGFGAWYVMFQHTQASHKIDTPDTPKTTPLRAESDTPAHSHAHGSEPLEYAHAPVHAAGEKALKAKESVLSKNKDRQTDSLPVVDLDTARTHEAPEPREPHNQSQPEAQFVSPFSKQSATDETLQTAPIPVPPPLPPDEREAVEAYEGAVGPLTTEIRSELIGLVGHYGLLAVKVAIANVQSAGRKGKAVQYPIAYIRGMLANQQQEGKLPGQNRSPARKPASAEAESERVFMKFTGWEKPAPKGVAS